MKSSQLLNMGILKRQFIGRKKRHTFNKIFGHDIYGSTFYLVADSCTQTGIFSFL